jgi:hypothetical protein
MKIKVICSHCKSDNVLRDAWAEWDIDKQEWVLHATYDETFCEDCEGSTSVEEVEIQKD